MMTLQEKKEACERELARIDELLSLVYKKGDFGKFWDNGGDPRYGNLLEMSASDRFPFVLERGGDYENFEKIELAKWELPTDDTHERYEGEVCVVEVLSGTMFLSQVCSVNSLNEVKAFLRIPKYEEGK